MDTWLIVLIVVVAVVVLLLLALSMSRRSKVAQNRKQEQARDTIDDALSANSFQSFGKPAVTTRAAAREDDARAGRHAAG